MHAEAYPLGEMKHGPLALVDENFCSVIIAPNDSTFKRSAVNIQEIRGRNGKILALSDSRSIENYVDDLFLMIPATLEYLSPINTNIPLQLFAYYMAIELGFNPDKPRNLAKVVTVG